MPRNDKWNALKAISIAAIPVVLAVGGWYIQRQLQDQMLRRDYVQLAVSILKEPDAAAKLNSSLRGWAVDLLRENSPTKLSDQLVNELKAGLATLPVDNPARDFQLEMGHFTDSDGLDVFFSVSRIVPPGGEPKYELIYSVKGSFRGSFLRRRFSVPVGNDPRVRKLLTQGLNDAQIQALKGPISTRAKSQDASSEADVQKLIAAILDQVQP